MTDFRSSNPKYPTLVGTKLASQLSLLIRQINHLTQLEQAVAAVGETGRQHRERWARRPPETERDWLDFWMDAAAVLDDVTRIRDQLVASRETMRRLAMSALDVVNHNGMNVTGTGTVEELEQLLEIARGLADEEGGNDE